MDLVRVAVPVDLSSAPGGSAVSGAVVQSVVQQRSQCAVSAVSGAVVQSVCSQQCN